MSINTILFNDVILDQLVDLIDAKSGNVASVSGVAPIVVAPSAGNVVVSLPIAGTWAAGSNDVVKGSSATALVWGSDGDSLTFDAPLVDNAGVVSLPIAGTWVAGSNDVVKGSSATSLEWGPDGNTVYTGSAPVDVTGTVISLPIAGTWAAGTNDVIKGSSATALFWANDNSKTYTATAPVDVTGTVISLPIAGTYSATNNLVTGSSATSLAWGTDTSIVYNGTAPVKVAGNAISLTIGGTFIAGSNDVVKGSASNALVWGPDTNTVYTATAPVDVTGTVISLPIAGTYSASNNVVKGSSATALEWGADGDSLTFSLPLLDTAGVVSLPIAGSFVAGVTDVVKGSASNALVWGSDSNSGGTVTSVAATAGGYCSIAGTPSVAPTVGLNVPSAGTSGQYLTASGVAGQLAFISPPAPTVYTATAPVDVTGTVISLPISGTFVAGSNDVVKGSSATALQWGSGATAGVSSITAGAGISVTGSSSVPIINADILASSFLQITPTGSVLDLNAPACPTSGYVLSSTAGGGSTGTPVTMSWVAQPAVTTAVYSPSSQSFASAPASVTPTSVSSLIVITMANLIMVMPSLDGFVLSTNAILPIGTVITLTITGLPTAGPLNQSTIAFEGDIINSTTASTITSMSGQWTFLSSTNTYSYESNPSIVASGPSDTFIIYPPMLIYTST